MQHVRMDSKEAFAAAGAASSGAADARAFPERFHAAAAAASLDTATLASGTGRTFGRSLFRFLRNAAIGLAVIASVPFVFKATHNDSARYNLEGTKERIAETNVARVLMAPVNAATTPIEAGLAFRAVERPTPSDRFPARASAVQHSRPWKQVAMTAGMFRDRAGGWVQPINNSVVLLAGKGVSPEELAYLKTVADAPIWRDFDLVARARAVDMLGGRFALPLQPDANIYALPMPQFADTKELAQAGVSRAAYYVAIGDNVKAEAALQSVVSFGFMFMDNGAFIIDVLIGRAIVGIGRDGLAQFYAATHTPVPAAFELALQPPGKLGPARPSNVSYDAAVMKARMLHDMNDATLPQALRYNAMQDLELSSCSSVRGMLFGPTPDVRAEIDRAATVLPRYPSEHQFARLAVHSLDAFRNDFGEGQFASRWLLGAAAFASTVLQNPRIEACTRISLP